MEYLVLAAAAIFAYRWYVRQKLDELARLERINNALEEALRK